MKNNRIIFALVIMVVISIIGGGLSPKQPAFKCGMPMFHENVKRVLYISTGTSVFAVDPKDGKLIGKKPISGRFGIVNPTIVGGSIYPGNSLDWIIALPVSEPKQSTLSILYKLLRCTL